MQFGGRFVDHTRGPFGGHANMAMDQALLESVSSTGIPVLRLYRWSEPTLTLGYFQRSIDRKQHDESVSVPMVRRCTGGGAIVHDQELTYSLSLPSDRSQRGASRPVYEKAHEAIRTALREQGFMVSRFASASSMLDGDENAFLCFERRTPEDLVMSGYKVVGSAQRRHGNALLQHGSILMKTSPYAPSVPGLEDLTGRTCDAALFVARFTELLRELLCLNFSADDVSHQEASHAKSIASTRFSQDSWNYRR